jgi:hypothetical protein
MLTMNFPEKAKLEIKVKNKFYTTTPNVFRSWHGVRRVAGKSFDGDVYCFNTNDLYRMGIPKAPVVKLKTIKITVIEPGYRVGKVRITAKSGAKVKVVK